MDKPDPRNMGQPRYIWGTFEWAEVRHLFRMFKRNGHACVAMYQCGDGGWWMKIRIE